MRLGGFQNAKHSLVLQKNIDLARDGAHSICSLLKGSLPNRLQNHPRDPEPPLGFPWGSPKGPQRLPEGSPGASRTLQNPHCGTSDVEIDLKMITLGVPKQDCGDSFKIRMKFRRITKIRTTITLFRYSYSVILILGRGWVKAKPT